MKKPERVHFAWAIKRKSGHLVQSGAIPQIFNTKRGAFMQSDKEHGETIVRVRIEECRRRLT